MYYLWLKDAQSGPFTFRQLQSMWLAGQVTAVTLYWQEGNRDWLPLNDLRTQLEEEPGGAAPATLPELRPVTGPITQPMLPPVPSAPPPPPTAASLEEVKWEGHPTLWHWTVPIFWGVILSVVLIGLFILFYVYCKWSSTRYRVTNRRVSVETGIFSRSSRELRIQDIRSIAARANIFGIGDVEFSSAAQADAEVMFRGLTKAAAIRDLVKQLQNEAA